MKLKTILAVLIISVMFAIPAVGAGSKLFSETPEEVAKALNQAKRSCNRADALKVATPAVVNKLFGKKCRKAGGQDPELQFMGCEKSGKAFRCSFYYEGGGMFSRVAKSGGKLKVIGVSFIAD
ncbi:MAG TPA: hypothetical protein VN643_07665 [Pyrinomonadaceae bacterium]|nr:hypothetical protein [Pyrinomonadaceae bacterium]